MSGIVLDMTQHTSPTVSVPTVPEWLRLPAPGKSEPHTGLKRSLLYDLIKARAVKSVAIRKPGCIRGVRLIHGPSLIAYLDRLANEQACEPIEATEEAAA